jgi:hypothetical protein
MARSAQQSERMSVLALYMFIDAHEKDTAIDDGLVQSTRRQLY